MDGMETVKERFDRLYKEEMDKYGNVGRLPPVIIDGSLSCSEIVAELEKHAPGTPIKIGNTRIIGLGDYLCPGCARFFMDGKDGETEYHEKNSFRAAPRVAKCPACIVENNLTAMLTEKIDGARFPYHYRENGEK